MIWGAEMAEIDLNLLSPELVAYIRTLEEKNKTLEQKIVKQQVQMQNLYEMLVNARKHTFGQSSEQSKYFSDSDQLNFFNEAEKEFNSGAAEPTEQTIRVAEHTRKDKRTKEELTRSLPHYEIDCTLEGEDKICDICGTELVCIGKEKVCSELVIIPQQMAVVDYFRCSYKCAACEKESGETVIQKAATPVPVMKKSMAAPATVAYVMQEKYENAVPLYRQERFWKSKGVELNRNTLANWVVRSSRWFEPVCEYLHNTLLQGDIVHADETEFQVLKEDGRTAAQKSRMWVFCSGKSEEKQIALYRYAPSRSGKVASEMLNGFTGYLQTDGSKAARALELVKQLSALEDSFIELPPEERKAKRAEQSKPVLDAYWSLVENIHGNQGSNLEKAQTYSLNQRKTLDAFLLDGRIEMTNNRNERAVKSFVIGRKNFLFADTARGADASARCYSVIETARMNNLDVYGYLLHLLTELPKFGNQPTDKQLESVMPWSQTLPEYCRKGKPIEMKDVVRT